MKAPWITVTVAAFDDRINRHVAMSINGLAIGHVALRLVGETLALLINENAVWLGQIEHMHEAVAAGRGRRQYPHRSVG